MTRPALAVVLAALLTGCVNFPPRCEHGVDYVRTDAGRYYFCRSPPSDDQ